MATSFSLAAFGRRMRVVADRFGKNVEVSIREAAIVADQVAVIATPVLTGRARAGWFVAIGRPVFSAGESTDPSGQVTIAQGRTIASTWRIGGGPIFITNGVPYIGRLDDGYSAQAPSGMTRFAVQAAQNQLKKARLLAGV